MFILFQPRSLSLFYYFVLIIFLFFFQNFFFLPHPPKKIEIEEDEEGLQEGREERDEWTLMSRTKREKEEDRSDVGMILQEASKFLGFYLFLFYFIFFSISLFLYFFISLFLYFFISLFLYFFISLFLFSLWGDSSSYCLFLYPLLLLSFQKNSPKTKKLNIYILPSKK